MRDRYSQKFLDHAKQSGIDAFETAPKKVIQEAAEITGDLIGNKTANKNAKVSKKKKKIQQNNLEKVRNELDKEMPKERYISPEEIENIIDDLRLISLYNNRTSKKW